VSVGIWCVIYTFMRRLAWVVILAFGWATAQGASLGAATDPEFGPYLVDGSGRTVYLFLTDRSSPGMCVGACLDRWPVVPAVDSLGSADGIDATLVGSFDRADAGAQATYAGWPLYRFAGDAAPGDIAGHGFGDVWFMVAPDGTAVAVAPTALSAAAEGFLLGALDELERQYLRRDQVDWSALRERALVAAAGARTAEETRPALAAAVASLGDRHTEFVTAPSGPPRGIGVGLHVDADGAWTIVRVNEGGGAAAAGLRAGDRLVALDGRPFMGPASILDLPPDVDHVELTIERPPLWETLTLVVGRGPLAGAQPAATGAMLGPKVGYIDLPGHLGGPVAGGRDYAGVVVGLLSEQADAGACGWVVDLRRNHGGQVLTMLAGIGPLLGDAPLGGVGVGEMTRRITYAPATGTATLPAYGSHRSPVRVRLPDPEAPVALLLGPATNSAGEWIAIMFRSRPATRSFGEPTSGLPTDRVFVALSDADAMWVTSGTMFDRTGRAYDEPLEPDEFVAIDWAVLGEPDDPVVVVAREWLLAQPACGD
jgi:carboxyl-terminal processing protease